MSGKRWSPERLEELQSLVDKQLTAQQIGLKMELTRNQVIGVCSRNKIKLYRKKVEGQTKGDIKSDTDAAKRKSRKSGGNWSLGVPPRPAVNYLTDFNLKRAEELKRQRELSEQTPDNPITGESEWSVQIGDADPGFGQCRTPLWGFWQRTGKICGRPVITGRTHCTKCRRLLYQAPVLRTRAPDARRY